MSFHRWSSALGALLLMSCGSDGEEAPAATAEDVRDVRVEIPTTSADYVDFVSGEITVKVGEDKMICTHFLWDGDDMAFAKLETMQGKFGHHAVLLGAKEPLPPGTTVDCTDRSEMNKYEAYTIGDQDLPPNHGIFLPKGKALVLQAHYLNAGDKPIKIRDVVRLKKMPIESVTTWASIFVTNHLGFSIPPHSNKELSFDCTVPADVRLLVLGGHMHEWGSRHEAQYGADEKSLSSIQRTDDWKPEYRDVPPIKLMFESPMELTKGALFRTTCAWKNDKEHELIFPEEMCTSFGYVAGSKEPIVCNVQ